MVALTLSYFFPYFGEEGLGEKNTSRLTKHKNKDRKREKFVVLNYKTHRHRD